MLGADLGITADAFWRLSFWELGAIAAAALDRNAESRDSDWSFVEAALGQRSPA